MMQGEEIKLCIIDDIKSVISGLTAIDWSLQQITVAGVASNGWDGLELIKQLQPDIIITDIRMPRMDGLTMLQEILELKHRSRVILISGYTDFEYAQRAVQLGAFDFVVKPFTEEDIVEVVQRARQQVLEDRSQILTFQEMEYKLKESLPLLRQEYFALLLKHPTPWEAASMRWEFLNIDLAHNGFVVMLINMDRIPGDVAELSVLEVELLRFSLHNVMEETIQRHTKSIFFRMTQDRFVAILNDPASVTVAEIAEACCRNVSQYTKFTISIGYGGRVDSVRELPHSYRQADKALTYHLFTEGNGAIGYEELPLTDQQIPLAIEHRDELLWVLRSGNSEKAIELLTDIAMKFRNMVPQPNPDYLLSLYEELAAAAIRTLYELVPQQLVQPVVDQFKGGREGAGSKLSELQIQLMKLCREGAELVKNNTLSEAETIIYKSLEYLQGQLDHNVTVAECAAYVHLSPSYYSSLLKRVTGMTFTQYVTTERINKAKLMIINGTPVQEVAAAVGYEERRYFSEMFKKMTSMTPSEFRESYYSNLGNSGRE